MVAIAHTKKNPLTPAAVPGAVPSPGSAAALAVNGPPAVELMIEPESLALYEAASESTPATHRGGLKARNFRIDRGTITAALGKIDDTQREPVLWLWNYCHQRDFGREEMGRLVRKKGEKECYSYDALYQLLTGRRTTQGADIGPMVEGIKSLRRKVEDAAPVSGFVETEMAKEIWDYCQESKTERRIGIIFGDMSIGKSEALKELAKRDPNVVYARMPTRGGRRDFMGEIARRSAMGDQGQIADLTARVKGAFSEDSILTIDEADQCFAGANRGLSTLDFVRELWDFSQCGLVMVFDHHGRDQILRGPGKERLKRLWRRRLPVLQLPDMPSDGDLALFAAKHGLDPAPEEEMEVTDARTRRPFKESPRRLQEQVCRQSGLAIWLSLLRSAVSLSLEKKQPVSWGAVIKQHAMRVARESEAGV